MTDTLIPNQQATQSQSSSAVISVILGILAAAILHGVLMIDSKGSSVGLIAVGLVVGAGVCVIGGIFGMIGLCQKGKALALVGLLVNAGALVSAACRWGVI